MLTIILYSLVIQILTLNGIHFNLNLTQLAINNIILELQPCSFTTVINFNLNPLTIIESCNSIQCQQRKYLTNLQYYTFTTNPQIYNFNGLFLNNYVYRNNSQLELLLIFTLESRQIWVIIPIIYQNSQKLFERYAVDIDNIIPYVNNKDNLTQKIHFQGLLHFLENTTQSIPIDVFNFLNARDYGHFFHLHTNYSGKEITYLISQKIYQTAINSSLFNNLSDNNLNLTIGTINYQQTAFKLCYGASNFGIFQSNLNKSYVLWAGWFAILLFWLYVIIPLRNSKNCFDQKFQQDKMTCWGFYSLHFLQHGQFFTKLSRATLLMIDFSQQCCVLSIIYYKLGHQYNATIIPWASAIAYTSSIPFSFILGYFFLRNIYNLTIWKHRLQIDDQQNLRKHYPPENQIQILDLNEKINSFYYWYYVCAFFLFMTFQILAVYLLELRSSYQYNTPPIYWAYSISLCFVFQNLVAEPILAYLFGNIYFYRVRGFFYNYQLGDTYKRIQKY